MKILDRYLARTVLLYSAMVMGVLLTLGGLFVFIGQQDDIGVGSYGAVDALLFSLLNLPQQAFELMPIGVLLGSLLGLGMLARGSELVVVRVSGVSVVRVATSVAIGGLLLMVLAVLLGEFIAPPLQKFARQQKVFSKFENVSVTGGGGWVKDDRTMIGIQDQSGDNLFRGIYVFRFRDARTLTGMARADSATVLDDGSWRLDRYAETRFENERAVAVRKPFELLRTNVDPSFLGLAMSAPQQLPSLGLLRLIRHLQANGLDTRAYRFAFWSRIARTCAIVMVALLAIPFVFGPLRSSGSGARLVIGILIGVGFFLLQRTLESGAIVFDLNPIALAWLPTALLALLTGTLISTTK